jgi:hypothetical protein
MRCDEARGPITVAATVEWITIPTVEVKRVRLGDRLVRVHRAKNGKDFFLHFAIGESFYSLGIVTLLKYEPQMQRMELNRHAYRHRYKEKAGAGKEPFEVKVLPDRIASTLRIGIERELDVLSSAFTNQRR